MLDSSSYPLAHHGNQLRDLFAHGWAHTISLYPALDERGIEDEFVTAKVGALADHIQERFSGLPYLDLITKDGHLLGLTPVNGYPKDSNGNEISPSFIQFDENGYEKAFYWTNEPENLMLLGAWTPAHLRFDIPISEIRVGNDGRIYKFSADEMQSMFGYCCYSTTRAAHHQRHLQGWNL